MTPQSLLALQITLALVAAVGMPFYIFFYLKELGNGERDRQDRAARQGQLLASASSDYARRHAAVLELAAALRRHLSQQTGSHE